MTSKVLDYSQVKDLQPATILRSMYKPELAPFRFTARDILEANTWQSMTRDALSETIGFQNLEKCPPEPQMIEVVDKGDYIREKILLRTSPWTLMPVYILLPKNGPRPLPVVIAFAGHGYGVKDVVGLWEDGAERDIPDGYHKDFGIALCRRGFAVAAPEISCFGERQSDFSTLNRILGQEPPDTCQHAATLAFHLGGSAVGLRVMDALRLVDYLEARAEIDIKRLGAMGISGGGMHTLFSTCIDPRIRACVISGYFCPWRESIFAMNHCTCNYVPGLHRFGEIYDLAGLVAPRPLLIEAGTHDPIFPIAGVEESASRARDVYAIFDARDKVETDIFEGRHRINGARAYDFLWENLSGG